MRLLAQDPMSIASRLLRNDERMDQRRSAQATNTQLGFGQSPHSAASALPPRGRASRRHTPTSASASASINASSWQGVGVMRSRSVPRGTVGRSEEHTSELQSRVDLVCRLLLEKKKKDRIEGCFDDKKNTDSTRI